LRHALKGHVVVEAFKRGWERLSNRPENLDYRLQPFGEHFSDHHPSDHVSLLRYGHMEPDYAPLGRLWPNREHESNWLKGLICFVGFHRWHTVRVRGSDFDFCLWCPRIRTYVESPQRQNKT
jgi:hypothetical protein